MNANALSSVADQAFIRQWIQGWRVGVTSYLLLTSTSNSEKLRLRELLDEDLSVFTSGSTWLSWRIAELPPGALHLLTQALGTDRGGAIGWLLDDADNVGDHTGDAIASRGEILKEAWGKLVGVDQSRRGGLLSFSMAFSHQMLRGWGSARDLIRLARRNLAGRLREPWDNLRDSAVLCSRFQECLEELREREPEGLTRRRLEALARLRKCHEETAGEALEGVGAFWVHVESAVIHQTLAWPLLVSRDEEASPSVAVGPGFSKEGLGVGVALPVAVDLEFGGKGRARPVLPPEPSLDIENWRGPLQRARDLAYDLWRDKHGNVGDGWRNGDFRSEMADADFIFDFRLADEIIRGMERIDLTDLSAIPYFTQVVLSRMLGRGAYLSSAVTGILGDQLPYATGAGLSPNHEFRKPGGVREKAGYVFSARLFERLVLPRGSEPDVRMLVDATGGWQPSEVNFADNILNVTDVVQTEGWRQFTYVRCPEIRWEILPQNRSRPGTNSPSRADRPRLERILAAIADGRSSPVLDLRAQDGVSPVDVAWVLAGLNYIMRTQHDDSSLQPGSVSLTVDDPSCYPGLEGMEDVFACDEPPDSVPPSLSWLFIRCVSDETDLRFWQTLFASIGCPPEYMQHMRTALTSDEAAQTVAAALNRFDPTREVPDFRSPDFIVVVAPEELEKSREGALNPLARPLDPLKVLGLLRQGSAAVLQRAPRLGHLGRVLGNIRLITVSEAPVAQRPFDLSEFSGKRRRALRCLARFRHGFTQHMAVLSIKSLLRGEFDTRGFGYWLRRDLGC
jgi:hypothetical protein